MLHAECKCNKMIYILSPNVRFERAETNIELKICFSLHLRKDNYEIHIIALFLKLCEFCNLSNH